MSLSMCTGINQQYVDTAECMDACSYFEVAGTNLLNNTKTGNSVECRMYHTDVANTTQDFSHCAHGNRWGTGVANELHCGDQCDHYCAVLEKNCAWNYTGYTDKTDCMADCTMLAWDVADSVPATTSGDSLTCRVYHAGVARGSKSGEKAHCPHASYFSEPGVCADMYTPQWEFNQANFGDHYDMCDDYCDGIEQTCTGDFAQYKNKADCMDACSYFKYSGANTSTTTTGDSVECRIYHIDVAETTQDLSHCFHGNRWGTGVANELHCGDQCSHYCHVLETNCLWNVTGYSDLDECKSQCATFNFTFDNDQLVPDSTSGNSLSCRVYHAQVSRGSAVDMNTHCPHTREGTGNNFPCSEATISFESPKPFTATNFPILFGLCDEYCNLTADVCTGESTQYVDKADCMDACSYMETTGAAINVSTGGNSVECRLYHTGVADTLDDPSHCFHGGRWGTAVADEPHCGTQCDTYCDLIAINCPTNETGYDDFDDCFAECEMGGIPWEHEAAVPTTVDGDSLTCRVYHAQVARGGGAVMRTHCPHATFESVEGVCTGEASGVSGSGGDDTGLIVGITVPTFVVVVAVVVFVVVRKRRLAVKSSVAHMSMQ
jgi:hypothetical protein